VPCYLRGQKRAKRKVKRRRCQECYKLIAEGKTHKHKVFNYDIERYEYKELRGRLETVMVDVCPRVLATELIDSIVASQKEAPSKVLVSAAPGKCQCGCGQRRLKVSHEH